MTQKIQRMVYEEMKEFYPEVFDLGEEERKQRLKELDTMYLESIRNA